MKIANRLTAALLASLLLCLACQLPALAEAAGGLTAYTSLDQISSHGNVHLVTDRRLLLQDLEAVGIECGDRVKVTFLDQVLEMPVDMNFSGVPTGEALLRVKDDSIELSINMGSFASEYIADPEPADGGKTTWTYKDGIEGPVEFRIELVEKRAPGNHASPQLVYTDVRSDYPNLTDEEFANFRMVATTGMGDGALYRTSSPINPKHNRSAYADAALKDVGVVTVMNLADSREEAENFAGYGDSYYSTVQWIGLDMEMSFDTDESRGKLAEGLRFFASHEGPYAVHCEEGKDRTGVVAALLECFMGATYDEVRRDYMATFSNYYGIHPGDAVYAEIAENNIATTLRRLFDVDELDTADLAEAATKYFRAIGLDDAEIENLRINLGKSYSA